MALVVKNLPASAGARGDLGLTPGSDPWTRKILWNRKWQPNTPVFLPGEFHGQRSLVGYSLWGHKESDTTEHTHTHTHTHTYEDSYPYLMITVYLYLNHMYSPLAAVFGQFVYI